jgi:phosphoribosylanthranilate isomerase
VVHTRIKICGITRPEDARAAADSGADAIGLVFYPRSPRAVSAEQAADIVAALPPFVASVALFVDESVETISRLLDRVSVDVIQFHGDETPAFCRQFSRPWIKALRVKPDMDIPSLSARYDGARAILLDAWQEGIPGGTGKRFDWSLVPTSLGRPMVLAGGLDERNVGAAVSALCPDAVDVSGGVESSPGIKDAGKIAGFVAAVKAAEQGVKAQTDDH